MSDLQTLLAKLRRAEVHLWVEDGKLKYRAKPGAMTEALKTEVAHFKPELIDFLSRAREADRSEQPAIERAERDGTPLPVSFAQQRLWFIDRLDEGAATYNIPIALQLEGELDVAVLARCFNDLIARHESLRVRFVEEGGQPRQVIDPPWTLNLTPEPMAAGGVDETAAAEAMQAFDLHCDRLIRVRLLRLASESYVLLVTLHHIIADGWSMGVLVEELSTLYAGYVAGGEPELPPLPVQYADYARWQRERAGEWRFERQLDYWRNQLDALPPLLKLPTDRPRPPVQRFQGGSLPVELPRELTDRLRELAQQCGATLFMTLLAVLDLLLWRYSGQDDFAVGTPVANRPRPELEGVIGFFANTLVLRAQPEPERSFVDWLERVKQTTLAAYAHQEVPFERVVEALEPERTLAHSPLFQVMLVLQNQGRGRGRRLPGLTLSELPREGRVSRFDLTLLLVEGDNGLSGELEYDTDLFDRATVERMMAHYRALLDAVASEPQRRLRDFTLAADESSLLAGASAALEAEVGAHRAFEASVERAPDAVALMHGDETLSYATLEARANRWARALRERGVVEGCSVGLRLRRGTAPMIAVLAVWKAGGAYVPMDPTLPAERLSAIAEDAAPELILVDDDSIPASSAIPEVSIVALENAAASLPATRMAIADDGRRPAYVMYTSGTTGRPKGIVLPHRALANLMRWERARMPGCHLVLQFASIGFDLSALELLLAVDTGGTLWLVDEDERLEAAELTERLGPLGIDVVVLPPAVLQQWALLPDPDGQRFASLRYVITAGEQLELTPEIRALFSRYPACVLDNQYGPAETHVVTARRFQAPAAAWPARAPIGTPVDNAVLAVVDGYGSIQPTGVPGELLVAGPMLALGYRNDPARTDERFVNADCAGESRRWYRTGDKVRVNAAGELEYLGRLDRQIKLRGFRVELDEIEARLNGMSELERAVVALTELPGQGEAIVAWAVPAAGERVSDEVVRQRLQQALPGYMVPSAIAVIDEIPLNRNGKPDSVALMRQHPPVAGDAPHGDDCAVPQGPIEERLQAIWQRLLPRSEAIAATDNFFAIGGHSLLAVQLTTHIHEAFGVALPVRRIFETPTIRELAGELDREARRGEVATAPGAAVGSIPALPRDGDSFALSHAQLRLWVLEQFEGIGGTYNMPLALALSGALDVPCLEACLNCLIARHETLRTRIVEHDGEPVQSIDDPWSCHLEPESVEREALSERFIDEGHRPFDLARGPLFRARLLRVGDGEHVLLLTLHHIVSDGWSTGVLVEELAELYRARSEAREPRLGPLPIQYVDYAAWQRNWLSDGELDRQLEYWREQLSGLPPLLALPSDRPRPPVQRFEGASVPVRLSGELRDGLQALARQRGATLYMTLLAVLDVLLWRYSGQEDIAVGTPVANRPRRELEGIVGLFVNTLAMRACIDEALAFRDFLDRVKDTALSAYEHQDAPFEAVVEALRPARNLAHSPLFQVMLVVQNAPMGELRLPGLELGTVPYESRIARFDLTFNLSEGPDGIGGYVEYSTALFDRATVERLVACYEVLLTAVARDPSLALGTLPMLPAAEQRALLERRQGRRTDYRADQSLHAAVRRQARRRPEAPAVRCGKRCLTYAELDREAGRYAQALAARGVEPGRVVGLMLAPSAERIVALLGVLYAGCAYLPLDPSYPPDRLRFMIEDAGVGTVITDAAGADDTGLDASARRIALAELAAGEASMSPAFEGSGDDLLYIMYTSGSTGTPKGVCVTHRNIMRLVDTGAIEGLHEHGVMLQHASLSFDASAFEIWGALTHGGELVVAEPGRAPVASVGELIGQCGVTVALFSPLLFQGLLSDYASALERMESIVVGGDIFQPADARRAVSLLPRTAIYNAYGPTENGCISTLHRLSAADDYAQGVPIGFAIDNARAYVLDAGQRLVPTGVPGELWVGGDGLARGYANRPELTAERFVELPGLGRLYRTGDWARQRADGALEYLGRNDHQVKLRGIRIELGEIEAALAAQPCVETAVAVCEGEGEQRRLVAYAAGEDLDERALERGLAERLPGFMLPARIAALARMPWTANGKIDRAALREHRPATTRSEPASGMEARVLALWQRVLGREDIGVDDNFFDIGGSSLLVMKLRRELEPLAEREVPVTEVFQYPTVSQQARHLAPVSDHAGAGETDANTGDTEPDGAEGGEERRRKRAAVQQRRRAARGRA